MRNAEKRRKEIDKVEIENWRNRGIEE